jgi:CheY-like chemotaxis protein
MTQRKRILLVDDDRDFVEATTAVLESICDVDVAFGGNEGLAKARASKPDLILLDVIMPDEDGFAVCDQIKADPQLAEVPVIMLTSLPDGLGPMGQATLKPCVEDYMEKPVKPVELLKRVSKFLAAGTQER